MRVLKDNILIQFSVASFVVLLIIAVALTTFLSNKIRSDAIDNLVNEAVGASSGRLLSAVTPSDLNVPMTGTRYEKFHQFVQTSVVSDRTARVKLWSKDGTVIYSNDPAGVGEKFPTKEGLLTALDGENAVEIKVAQDAENERERFLGTLMEVYTPIVFLQGAEPAGAFEIYQYYQPTADRINAMQDRVLWSVSIGFLALYGTLVSIVWRGWRTITKQRTRLEATNSDLESTIAKLETSFEVLRISEIELQQSHRQVLIASKAKSEFLASMSHEIRTPMNAIIGTADLLSASALSQEQRQYVQVFQAAGDTLMALINDILDLSKIESGQLSLESTPFDLGQLIESTARIFAMGAHEKGLELNTQVHPDVITSQIGDPTRLRQVLSNLLANAIKFTESGEVTLRLNQDASGSLQFQVSDTGIGIPQDKQALIFDSFCQADSTTTREYGGTGLGLAISQRLVGMMGGRIWVESQPGQGSAFYFTVHLEPQSSGTRWSSVPGAEHAQGFRVLVVDDNSANRMILQELLSSWDARVTVAADGLQALEELKHAKQDQDSYQMVLLDHDMPGADGFVVAERMNSGGYCLETTVLMLASDNRSKDNDRRQELNITRYLVKPLRRGELIQVITDILGLETAPNEVDPETLAEDLGPIKILLVEDSKVNRMVVQSYLKNTPYQLEIAENGQKAVEQFRSQPFDLVLMDMQMPVMDGYTATQVIREWEKEAGKQAVPIIALTADALKEDVARSLMAGCNAHLSKPIRQRELMLAISQSTRSETL